ncbi:MAG: cell wall-binding repeat-containing protein [Thermoplasmata archaeon]|nr:cell wall-binding repeat-containing protein [Thermoplasmata archaeon]
MKLTHVNKQLLALFVITIIILAGIVIYFNQPDEKSNPKFKLYTNDKLTTLGTIFVQFEEDNLHELKASVAYAPVATGDRVQGQSEFQPIFYSTHDRLARPVQGYMSAQTEEIELEELGDDENQISIAIAKKYWSEINTIILVTEYEDALVAAPLASELNAPIIYDGAGTQQFLNSFNIKSAIVMGDNVRHYYDIGLHKLSTHEDIWGYYIEILEGRQEECEYIVVTNPNDINFDDTRYFIPGLSIVSGILSSERNALVVTGDYTVNLTWIQSLGYGTAEAGAGERGGDDDETTDDDELELLELVDTQAIAVDRDIDYAVEYLSKHGFNAKYLAIVGGPSAVPMLYLKSPVWYEEVDQEERGEEYLATDTYYGDLDIKLIASNISEGIEANFDYKNSGLYTQELAVGRIIAPDILDASALVTRTIGYWDYEYERERVFDRDSHWSRRTVIMNSLMCGNSDNMAAQHQKAIFTANMMLTEEYTPDRTAATTDVWVLDVKKQMEKVNAVVYDGHGYPDGWYYMWTSTHDNKEDWDRLGAEDVMELNLHPMPVFGACCLSSALDWPKVWDGAENENAMAPEKIIALAFIHAGAIGYIGATEESWGSFVGGLADGEPDSWGYGDFDMPTMFWTHLLGEDITVGMALNKAKADFYDEEWQGESSRPFARLCIMETVLYGDPAALPCHPGFTEQ